MKYALIYSEATENDATALQYEVLSRQLKKTYPDCRFTHARNQEAFISELGKSTAFNAVLIDWSTASTPTHAIEEYFDSPNTSAIPIIYYTKITEEESALFAEYDVKELARISDPLTEDSYKPLTKLISAVLENDSNIIKTRLLQVELVKYLVKGDTKKAKKAYTAMKSQLDKEGQVYYFCLIIKEEGDHAQVVKRLSKLSMPKSKSVDLLGASYYALKQYADAASTWVKMDGGSPLNLRRKYLTYRAFDKLAEKNKNYRSDAMNTLLSLNKLNPNYGKVNDKIVRLIMSDQNCEHLRILENLLPKISDKEALKVFSKTEALSDPFKSQFVRIFVKTLSGRAAQKVKSDDISAIRFYKCISKLLPQDNKQQQAAISFGIARAYFYFGQLDTAKEFNDKALVESENTNKRAVNLAKLIEKASNGDFDVLIDKEEDWNVV